MPKSVETNRPKLGRKDVAVLFVGIGTCISAGLGTMGMIPLPGL